MGLDVADRYAGHFQYVRADRLRQTGRKFYTAARRARRWLRRSVRAFRISLAPRTSLEAQLVNAQLKMVRGATRPFAFILPPVSVLVAWATSPWVARPVLIAWCAAITATCIGFEFIYRHIERSTDDSPAGVRTRATAFTGMGVLVAAIWASMGIVMWAPDSAVNHMLLILILASSLSGWSAIGSVHLASGRLPLLCYGSVMVLAPLFSAYALDHALAGLCLAFSFVIAMQAVTTYDTARKMLSLQFERTGLIANLRRAMQDSEGARVKAEAASLAKSQFLANMSHELRTPMNAILGFSELIGAKAFGAATDKYSEYGKLIHGSGQHLLSLINDILDLAKIEAGRMELSESDIDFDELAREAARLVAPRAQQVGVRIETEIAPRLPLLNADPRAVRQILDNLLSNAIKFTPQGGRVTVFASTAADGLVFGVEDTGIGIDEEDLGRVFESFGQGRHDITTLEKGTGLGLPIVKGLVEAHGGKVRLASQRDRGTTVSVTMPAHRLVVRPRTQLISTGPAAVMSRGGWGA